MSEASPQFDSKISARGLRIAILVSRFNSAITEQLLKSALEAVKATGGDADVHHAPGAWELPLLAKVIAESGKHDAIVCLGAVIRGETPHFDFVAGEAARGISAVSLEHRIPIAFGVLTTNTLEQAQARVGRGYDAAMTAIEMTGLIRGLKRAG